MAGLSGTDRACEHYFLAHRSIAASRPPPRRPRSEICRSASKRLFVQLESRIGLRANRCSNRWELLQRDAQTSERAPLALLLCSPVADSCACLQLMQPVGAVSRRRSTTFRCTSATGVASYGFNNAFDGQQYVPHDGEIRPKANRCFVRIQPTASKKARRRSTIADVLGWTSGIELSRLELAQKGSFKAKNVRLLPGGGPQTSKPADPNRAIPKCRARARNTGPAMRCVGRRRPNPLRPGSPANPDW
jgi:hypothetical protein